MDDEVENEVKDWICELVVVDRLMYEAKDRCGEGVRIYLTLHGAEQARLGVHPAPNARNYVET